MNPAIFGALVARAGHLPFSAYFAAASRSFAYAYLNDASLLPALSDAVASASVQLGLVQPHGAFISFLKDASSAARDASDVFATVKTMFSSIKELLLDKVYGAVDWLSLECVPMLKQLAFGAAACIFVKCVVRYFSSTLADLLSEFLLTGVPLLTRFF